MPIDVSPTDKIVVSILAAILAWLTFLTVRTLDVATEMTSLKASVVNRRDVIEMIQDASPYNREKALVQERISNLSSQIGNLSARVDYNSAESRDNTLKLDRLTILVDAEKEIRKWKRDSRTDTTPQEKGERRFPNSGEVVPPSP